MNVPVYPRGGGIGMSSYGWTYLSRNALRRADRQLASNGEGVRDEIGFLIIHQRYADYFFPGTSVLHTRLRYALFVPWIYQTLFEQRFSGRAIDALQKAEIDLAGRLRDAKGGGAIGREKYPAPISQPPSVSYWGALGTWGILKDQNGRLPSRAHFNAILQSKHRRAFDDDGQPLGQVELPFTALPKPPVDWIGNKPMQFDLLQREAEFLRGQLIDLRPHSAPEQLSLFAKLAASKRVEANHCWDAGIAELAKEDGQKLRRAGYAASLAAIGRAVYAALVETLREEEDHQPTSHIHRDFLPGVIEEHGPAASRMKICDLIMDTGPISPAVTEVLERTILWLEEGAKDIMALRGVYEYAECTRKMHRARLSRLHGASLRLEWSNENHALAGPLHYRWDQVSRLLSDLWNAA
jgi:Family of unknown function (DUF6361)